MVHHRPSAIVWGHTWALVCSAGFALAGGVSITPHAQAQPHRVQREEALAAEGLEQTRSSESTVSTVSTVSTAPNPSRPVPMRPRSVHEAIARYAHEPSVEWVVHTTWARHTVHPDSTDQLASRARASGWVPQLRILGRAASIQGQNERLTETPWASWTDSRNYSLVVALTMRLDRMMFTPDESGLLRQKDQLRRERWEMAKHISKVYFERRRLQVERDLDGVATVERELKIAELEALLNAWTGGQFAARTRTQAIGR